METMLPKLIKAGRIWTEVLLRIILPYSRRPVRLTTFLFFSDNFSVYKSAIGDQSKTCGAGMISGGNDWFT